VEAERTLEETAWLSRVAASSDLICGVHYAQLNPLFCNGNVRILFPVAANTAFPTAGKIGGSVGSPNPSARNLT
jgi:hypothetical protein